MARRTAPQPIAVVIGRETIPLTSRPAAILELLARYQSQITHPPHCKVIFDCSPTEVTIAVHPPHLGRVKVGK